MTTIKKIDELTDSQLTHQQALASYVPISGIGSQSSELQKVNFETFKAMLLDNRMVEPHEYWRVVIHSNNLSSYSGLSKLELYRAGSHHDVTSLGGTPLGSGTPANAFNGTGWNAPLEGAWVGFRFNNPVGIIGVGITAAAFTDQSPKEFTVEWSDDGSDWHECWSVDSQIDWANHELRRFVNPEPVWISANYDGTMEANRRIWAYYDGVAGTMRAGNGLTITKTAVGVYSVMFDQPMLDTNYAVFTGAAQMSSGYGSAPVIHHMTKSVNGFSIRSYNMQGLANYDTLLSIEVIDPTVEKAGGFLEAPIDGRVYARRNGQWIEIGGDGGARLKVGVSYNVADADVMSGNNVASVTKTSVGKYRIAFTSALVGTSGIAALGTGKLVSGSTLAQVGVDPAGEFSVHYVDILVTGGGAPVDPEWFSFEIYDPTVSGGGSGSGSGGGSGGGGGGEPPYDGKLYARLNDGWSEVIGDAPTDGKQYVRQSGAWEESIGGAAGGGGGGLIYGYETVSVHSVSTGGKHQYSQQILEFTNPPPVGTTVFILVSTHPTAAITVPTGFVRVLSSSPANNQGFLVYRAPADGTTAGYPVTVGDGGVSIAYAISGDIALLDWDFSPRMGNTFSYFLPPHRFGVSDVRIIAMEHDGSGPANLTTPDTDWLVTDFVGVGVGNHAGAFYRLVGEPDPIVTGVFSGGDNFIGVFSLSGKRVPYGLAAPWQISEIGTGPMQEIGLPEAGLASSTVSVYVNGLRYSASFYSISGSTLTINTRVGDMIEVQRLPTPMPEIAINARVKSRYMRIKFETPVGDHAGWGMRNIAFLDHAGGILNTDPDSGFASSTDSTTDVSDAYDSSSETGWFSGETVGPQYLGYDFGTEQSVDRISILPLESGEDYSWSLGKVISVERSDDGVVWHHIQSVDIPWEMGSEEVVSFKLLNMLATPKQPEITYAVPIRTVSTNTVLGKRHAGGYLRVKAVNEITVTIPNNMVAKLPIGTQVSITRVGTGAVRITAQEGVIFNTPYPMPVLRAQYSAATLTKVGNNEWDIAGDIGDLV